MSTPARGHSGKGAHTRRHSREAAFQVLFANHFSSADLHAALALVQGIESQQRRAVDEFASRLLTLFEAHSSEVDRTLALLVTNWSPERLSPADRTALRLGTVELLYLPDIPRGVVINEYIEIARNYGDDDSPRFVNGVLDRVAREADKLKNS